MSGQLNKASGALPEASRRAENRLRQAFFEEVGRALTVMEAAPALRAPKKIHGDADVCLRCGMYYCLGVNLNRWKRVVAAEKAMKGWFHEAFFLLLLVEAAKYHQPVVQA